MDQGHAEILMKYMGIDEESRGVAPRGATANGGLDVKGDKSESKFPAIAVRGKYLGQDKMDMQHAAQEISTFTCKTGGQQSD